MTSNENTTPPARGRGGRDVVWDRASWHSVVGGVSPAAEEGRHIGVILRWLWAHDLTTAAGDLAAQGSFAGEFGSEPALTSAQVGETGALFLDHFYGRWLATLPDAGSGELASDDLDTLWDEFARRRTELDRVWEL
jgi:hypothetical protein